MEEQTDPRLAAVASLDDRTRHALYRHVSAQHHPVTRDEAAAAVGVDRSVAAYHLDRLVADGLLVASFARPEGRTGPGAGRPSKRYERSPAEITVSLPPRSYEVLAELLATAVESDASGSVRTALAAAATSLGRTLGGDSADLVDALAREGFEPYADGEVVRLANCPFHQLAQRHTDLVCHMNLALMDGVTETAAAQGWRPHLDPAPGRCCVAFERAG